MSTYDYNTNGMHQSDPLPADTNLDLNKIQCEIKLVNNWKKLKLRSRFSFCKIDPVEIKAMMLNYYQIYCSLETKLEFGEFDETFVDIPNIDDIVSFLNNGYNDTESLLLSIQIELPLLILRINHENSTYYFYGFANGKLLLYQDNEEINTMESMNKNKILYHDILCIFNLNHKQYRFGHPKNVYLELNMMEEVNITQLNELDLKILKLPNIDRCVICLSNISYEFEEYCRISSCSHIYHFECIENLIKYGNDNQCPLCRGKVKYAQYLYNNSINKIFKITNNALSMISSHHYLNKYYHSIKYRDYNAENQEYDEKDEGIIRHIIPQKPCLGYLESMPSPTNSNSSVSIPPTRHSSPSITHLQLNNDGDNNNNNNNGNSETKSFGFFETNHDKTAGEDD